jgi:acyl-CoA thioesterase I
MMDSLQAKYAWTIVMVSVLAGCGGAPAERPRTASAAGGSPPGADREVVLFLGTSLTAGYGLDPDQAYPALIQARIDAAGLPFRVVNAGVSGETSAGALRRTDWLFEREHPAVLVVETGANDGLRGQDPDTLRANLGAIFDRARGLDPPPRLVLLAMEALPNLGPRYALAFRAVYPEVARAYSATLVPFFLDGVAGVDSLNQADGIHPTARGQEIAAGNLWGELEPVLREAAARASRSP